MNLTLPNRETLQCRLNSSEDAEKTIPDLDKRILELLLEAPMKRVNPCQEKFALYQSTMEIYDAACSGQVQSGIQMLGNRSKRLVYDLLFNAISHYNVLEDILIESAFFSRFFHLHDAGLILYIILYDFQSSNFTIPFHRLPDPDNKINEIIPDIAQALNMHKTKLNGTLARMCVRSSVPIISELIDKEVVRESCLTSIRSPCYARVNVLKCSQDDVLKKLQERGYQEIEYLSDLRHNSKSFCVVDTDFLAFSADCRRPLDFEPMTETGHLALQNMRSYRFVKKMEKTIRSCKGDILVTEPHSGFEIAHIATLLGFQGKVFVYDSNYMEQAPLAQKRIKELGVPNIIFTKTSFACISGDEDYLRDVEIIFCLPETLPSGKESKTDLAMEEGDHLLPFLVKSDLSDGGLLITDVFELNACVSTALALRRAKTIIYKTSSEFQVYNENVVRKQVDEFNELAQRKQYTPYKITSITLYSKMDSFSAVIEKEVKTEEAASSVIARAIANGLIKGDGLFSSSDMNDKCKDSAKQKKLMKPFKASLSTTISYQQKCKPKRNRDARGPSKPTFKF